MGVENILEKIALEASSSAESLIKNAQNEASEITKKAKIKASESSAANLENAEKNAIDSINHIKSMAALESRKMRLSAKRDVIEETFKVVTEKLLNLSDTEYTALLVYMAHSSADRGTIWFSERDFRFADSVRPYLKSEFKISKSTVKKLSNGFIIKNGNIQVTCTVEELLSVNRSELESVAAKVLFSV